MTKDIVWDLVAWLLCAYVATRWWKYQRMDAATRRKRAPGGGQYAAAVRAPWLFLMVAAGLLAAAVSLLFEIIG